MNGKFASEKWIVDEGDTVEIHLTSNISQPFTLHGHGIEQVATPWMDGVPGVTQPMIKPGATYTYRFAVNQHGLYHLHAHSKAMQDDGLFLGLFVRPSLTDDRPFAQISSDPTDIAQLIAAESNTETFLINDWRHYKSDDITTIWHSSNVEPLCVQSILINGQGASVCPSAEELAVLADARGLGNVTELGCLPITSPIINPPSEGFGVQSDVSVIPDDLWKTCSTAGVDNPLYTVTVDNAATSWAVFSFINAGGLWEQLVSIDEHPMYVFEVEGEYVNVSEPVSVIPLISGQRVSVAVKLDKAAGSSYTIRVASNVVPQFISGYAILQYAGDAQELVKPAAGYPALPTSTASLSYSGALLTTADGLDANATLFDESGPAAAPYIANPPPSNDEVKQTLFFDMSRPNATIWAINNTGLPQGLYEDNESPLIWDSVWKEVLEADDGPLAGTPLLMAKSVYVVPEKDSVVDLVFLVPNQNSPPHPIHKHFNKFWVTGSGTGLFNWSSVAEAAAEIPENFNFVNPPVRDGFNTPVAKSATGGSWLALRYIADEPGPMTLHCHITQHAAGGMVAVILQAMDQMQVPAEYAEPSSS
ncbi:multicopper oxidase-domain-containing protein [Mucidula mucida]|nr:multicopper oxidase-domain-containing protein [Mucidula mucida]